ARHMLNLRAGDCDDMTILLGSMLEATGHPVRLVLVGSNPKKKNLYSHIYLETQYKKRWIALDPTMRKPLGWAPKAVNRKIIPLR
ncbi:MAG: transglutaminase domain-containing protein, partial [bacterium]